MRYDGTAGLTGALGLGDLTDLEYAAQRAVTEWAALVPAWLVPLIVALVAVVVAWRRRGGDGHPAEERERVDTH